MRNCLTRDRPFNVLLLLLLLMLRELVLIKLVIIILSFFFEFVLTVSTKNQTLSTIFSMFRIHGQITFSSNFFPFFLLSI